MKIKKHSESVVQGLKSIAEKGNFAMPTLFSLDIQGHLVIEKFNKLLDYNAEIITLETAHKIVQIYGENLKIDSCSKDIICISGIINKLEIFEVK